jgi:aminopeptidase N
MMSESLAQYSALMIMEKEYGPNKMQQFLKHELDRYLRGRSGEKRREPPLTLVQNEPYVWYNKGSLAMYALRDYLGEDTVNGALRKYLLANRYATGPYPDTRGFLAAMQEAAPPEMRPLVTDLLDSIVLFDNKTTTATWTQLPDGKYKVKLAVEARKLKSDGLGAETETPLNDWIDVGVFSGDPNHEKVLYLEKRKFIGKDNSIEVIVNEKPERAGIDPYHKLIDRKPDDNTVNVGKS